MHRLGPEARAVVSRKLFEHDVERRAEGLGGERPHVVHRQLAAELARDGRERGVLEPARRDPARERRRVEVVETDRGGKSTYHGPGQLVCYPILDLNHHGRDVKKYCRDLEEAIIRTLAALDLTGERIDGLTGVWLTAPPRKIASIGVHISRWVTTHGYALNVDLDPAPFTSWITACGLEDAAFTAMARELGRPLTVDEVRPAAAAALAEVFDLAFEELPAEIAAA